MREVGVQRKLGEFSGTEGLPGAYEGLEGLKEEESKAREEKTEKGRAKDLFLLAKKEDEPRTDEEGFESSKSEAEEKLGRSWAEAVERPLEDEPLPVLFFLLFLLPYLGFMLPLTP